MAKITFKIEGSFITNHARDLVIEQSFDAAIRFLKESIIDFSYDNCIEIISGKSKLIGVNNLKLVKENKNNENLKKYLNDLNYLYSNVVLDGNTYFKPYGFISKYSILDVNSKFLEMNKYNKWIGLHIPSNLSDAKNVAFSLARATFYMKNPRVDKAVICKINNIDYIVLFEEIYNYPIFLNPIKGPNAYQKSIENVDLIDLSREIQAEAQVLSDSLLSNEKELEKEPETDPLVLHFQKLIEKGFRQAHDIKSPCGWLDPKGNIIPCEYYQHSTLAYVISEKLNLNSTNLEQHGYVKLQNNMFFLSFLDYVVTQSQYDTIFDYCEAHNLDFPQNISVK